MSIKINAVTPTFVAFYLHKKYIKKRQGEQFLLTKRQQCIKLMELVSDESQKKKENSKPMWINSHYFFCSLLLTQEVQKEIENNFW